MTMEAKATWFQPYLEQLVAMGFKPDFDNTSADGNVASFNSLTASAAEVKAYFKGQGFKNTDGRIYMAHTGNPHVNLDKGKNTVQISWYPSGLRKLVGVSFLGGTKIEKKHSWADGKCRFCGTRWSVMGADAICGGAQ